MFVHLDMSLTAVTFPVLVPPQEVDLAVDEPQPQGQGQCDQMDLVTVGLLRCWGICCLEVTFAQATVADSRKHPPHQRLSRLSGDEADESRCFKMRMRMRIPQCYLPCEVAVRAFPSRDAIALCYRRPKAQGLIWCVTAFCRTLDLTSVSREGQKQLMKPPPFVRGMFRFVTYMTTINGYKDNTNMCVFSFFIFGIPERCVCF